MQEKDYSKKLNYLTAEIEHTYDRISAYFGLSGAMADILYILEKEGDGCEQSRMYKLTMNNRKTISSALARMQADGYLTLKKKNGRENYVFLSEKGKQLLHDTGEKITQAEERSYDSWTDEERSEYLRLIEKNLRSLQREFDLLRKEGK